MAFIVGNILALQKRMGKFSTLFSTLYSLSQFLLYEIRSDSWQNVIIQNKTTRKEKN